MKDYIVMFKNGIVKTFDNIDSLSELGVILNRLSLDEDDIVSITII